MAILKWIWSNLTAIKDILWIVFTLIATIIAILTYKRARYTILQPLRSEVIKKQTDLIIEIMTNFSDESQLLWDLDFSRIVDLNTFLIMKQYGYLLKDSDKLEQECKKHLIGGVIVKRSEQLDMFELVATFEKTQEDKPVEDFGKVLYENLKQGKIDIEMIQLTRKYDETIKKYQEFSNNSFLPNELKEPLDKIIENITFDISHTIKQVLEQFILDLYTKSKETKNFKINSSGVYNEFNRKRRDNADLLKQIRSRTREYLLIDKKW